MKGKADIIIKAAVEVKGSDIAVDLEGLPPRLTGRNVVTTSPSPMFSWPSRACSTGDPQQRRLRKAHIAQGPGRERVNCRFPAAWPPGCRSVTSSRKSFTGLAHAVPDRVIAASGGTRPP